MGPWLGGYNVYFSEDQQSDPRPPPSRVSVLGQKYILGVWMYVASVKRCLKDSEELRSSISVQVHIKSS